MNLYIFKKLIKLLVYCFSPFIITLILIIRPFIKIRFSYQSSERIGDIATPMEVYLSEKALSKKNKYLDIFILTNIIANKTYIELLKKKVIILPNTLTYPIYHLILILKKNIKFFNNLIFKTKWYDSDFTVMRTNCNLVPDEYFIEKGYKFLESINVPKNAKIICLIVRDNSYLRKNFSEQNWEYHEHRNSNIENYKLAINEAINKGYYVFRMGQDVSEKLLINDSKFIDYSNKYRSDFLDVFLAYKCKFCITTGTGWDSLPSFVFRKPTIFTNFVPVGAMTTYSKKFMFSIKIHYDRVKNKKMNLKEISESPVAYTYSSKTFEASKIDLIENTPEDLKDLTLEMIDKIENNFFISDKELENQNKFWSKYTLYFKIEKIKSDRKKKIDPLLCTTNRLFKNEIISIIGNNFLKKNQFLIEE